MDDEKISKRQDILKSYARSKFIVSKQTAGLSSLTSPTIESSMFQEVATYTCIPIYLIFSTYIYSKLAAPKRVGEEVHEEKKEKKLIS